MDYERLASRLGVKSEILPPLISNIDGHYRSFAIPKRRGGVRIISAPSSALLNIQRKILQKLLTDVPVHPAAKAYVPKRSLKENARFHIGQKTLIKLDICDFFGSITDEQVMLAFSLCTSDQAEARTLTKLCTLHGTLPQGAATSGYLSNLAFAKCDKAIMRECRKSNLRYTRYADDIAISGVIDQPAKVIEMVAEQIQPIGLNLNHRKTFVARKEKDRQTVTGIVVNEKLSPGRQFLRSIRQDIHFALKWGLTEHAARRGFVHPNDCLRNLEGRVAFASQILKDRDLTDDWKASLKLISAKLDLEDLNG